MKPFPRLLAISATFLLVTLPSLPVSAARTVRVDVTNGAPRLMVDGTAVRARFFFGGSGGRPLGVDPITAKARLITFEFSPGADALNTGTIHFRFGDTPGEIDLDDFRMTDLDSGVDVIPLTTFDSGMPDFEKDWAFWPTGSANTVATVKVESGKGRDGSPALHIKLQAPPDGKWPGFHLFHQANLPLQKDHRYRVSFWAMAEPSRKLMIGFYRPGNPYVNLAPDVFPQQIKLASAAGVNLISHPLAPYWPKPGAVPDWSAVDAGCQAALNANPNALLLPRIGVYAPDWWLKAHPGEAMAWDARGSNGPMFSVASSLWRQEAAKHLATLITHLEEKFGEHMAGYHICGQNTAEWFYYGTWDPQLNGYAECDGRAFREWLAGRYRHDDALRAAWHDPKASLATATVPSPAQRSAAPAGMLRDSATEQPVIDFSEFQQESMASCVTELAHVVREASHGRKLVVFFYGYVFEFSGVKNGPATSGHYALRRVLNCPDIDVLCSPISYFDRGLGGNASSMTAAESVALAGKMWLAEDDTATYLSLNDFPGSTERVDTVEKTNEELVRNTAQCALRNFATWWMDLGAVGWFNDPRLWEEMARIGALDRPLLEHPTPFRPEVAAVIDESSLIRVASGGHIASWRAAGQARQALGRMGCPFGQYLLDDVTAGKVPAKLYAFLTAWHLSPDQRRKLLEATRGATRIWCYAPGYQEGDRTSLEAMRELTGFRVKRLSKVSAQAEPTDAGRKLGLVGPVGFNQPIEPLFGVADATPEESLATYPDGSTAIALRRTADGVSLFVSPPGLTPELLRLAADQSKVHLFTRTNCNVYANGPFLLLHGSQDGQLNIDIGKTAAIHDVMTGREIGQGPQWSLHLKKGETRVLRIGE